MTFCKFTQCQDSSPWPFDNILFQQQNYISDFTESKCLSVVAFVRSVILLLPQHKKYKEYKNVQAFGIHKQHMAHDIMLFELCICIPQSPVFCTFWLYLHFIFKGALMDRRDIGEYKKANILLVSHVSPVKPSGHVQVKDPASLLHEAPFKHGSLSQAVRTANISQTDLMRKIFYLISI